MNSVLNLFYYYSTHPSNDDSIEGVSQGDPVPRSIGDRILSNRNHSNRTRRELPHRDELKPRGIYQRRTGDETFQKY